METAPTPSSDHRASGSATVRGILSGGLAMPQTKAEPSSELRLSASSTAQAILSGGHAIAQFLKDVLSRTFQEKQYKEVSSLRHQVPCGDPTGVLAVHLKGCRKFTSSASSLRRQTLCCVRVSVGAVVKYTMLQPYKEHLSSSSTFSLYFNERKYLSIQIPMHDAEDVAMWESEPLNMELVCIDPRTNIPKVFGKGSIKLLEILDKSPFTHQFNLKVNSQVICKLEANLIFTYGSFGYGYSHQIKHPYRTMQDEVERSIFLRVPPPEDRRESHYNVITPSTLPPVDVVSSLIQQHSPMSSGCGMPAVVEEHIQKRGRFLQMYEALEKCETGKEMVDFLERIILKSSPSWLMNRAFKDATRNQQDRSAFFLKAPAFRKQTTGPKPPPLPPKPAPCIASSSKTLPGAQRHEIAVPPSSEEESKEQSPSFHKALVKKAGSKPTQSSHAMKAPKQTPSSRTTYSPSRPAVSICLCPGTSAGTWGRVNAVHPASGQEFKEQSPSFQDAPGKESDFMQRCTAEKSSPRRLKTPVLEDTSRGFFRWLSDLRSQMKSALASSLETAELSAPSSDALSSLSAWSGEAIGSTNEQLNNRSAGSTPASLEFVPSISNIGSSPGPLEHGWCAPKMDVSSIHSYLIFSTLTHTSPPCNHPSPGRTLNLRHSQRRFDFFSGPTQSANTFKTKITDLGSFNNKSGIIIGNYPSHICLLHRMKPV